MPSSFDGRKLAKLRLERERFTSRMQNDETKSFQGDMTLMGAANRARTGGSTKLVDDVHSLASPERSANNFVTETVKAIESHKRGDELDEILSPSSSKIGTPTARSVSHDQTSDTGNQTLDINQKRKRLPSLKKLRKISRSFSLPSARAQAQPSKNTPTLGRRRRRTPTVEVPETLPVKNLYQTFSLRKAGSPAALKALSQLSRRRHLKVDGNTQSTPRSALRVPEQILVPSGATTPNALAIDEDSWSGGSNSGSDGLLLQLGHLMDPRQRLFRERKQEGEMNNEGSFITDDDTFTTLAENMKPTHARKKRLFLRSFIRLLFKASAYMIMCYLVLMLWRSGSQKQQRVSTTRNVMVTLTHVAQNDSPSTMPKPNNSDDGVQNQREFVPAVSDPPPRSKKSSDAPFEQARSDLDAVFAGLERELQKHSLATGRQKGGHLQNRGDHNTSNNGNVGEQHKQQRLHSFDDNIDEKQPHVSGKTMVPSREPTFFPSKPTIASTASSNKNKLQALPISISTTERRKPKPNPIVKIDDPTKKKEMVEATEHLFPVEDQKTVPSRTRREADMPAPNSRSPSTQRVFGTAMKDTPTFSSQQQHRWRQPRMEPEMMDDTGSKETTTTMIPTSTRRDNDASSSVAIPDTNDESSSSPSQIAISVTTNSAPPSSLSNRKALKGMMTSQQAQQQPRKQRRRQSPAFATVRRFAVVVKSVVLFPYRTVRVALKMVSAITPLIKTTSECSA